MLPQLLALLIAIPFVCAADSKVPHRKKWRKAPQNLEVDRITYGIFDATKSSSDGTPAYVETPSSTLTTSSSEPSPLSIQSLTLENYSEFRSELNDSKISFTTENITDFFPENVFPALNSHQQIVVKKLKDKVSSVANCGIYTLSIQPSEADEKVTSATPFATIKVYKQESPIHREAIARLLTLLDSEVFEKEVQDGFFTRILHISKVYNNLKTYFLVLSAYAPGKSLKDIVQDQDAQIAISAMQRAGSFLRTFHDRGKKSPNDEETTCLYGDAHLGNFILNKDKVILIDPDARADSLQSPKHTLVDLLKIAESLGKIFSETETCTIKKMHDAFMTSYMAPHQ